nr:TRAP transporter substrate-binding protein [Acidisphaera sp. L21]
MSDHTPRPTLARRTLLAAAVAAPLARPAIVRAQGKIVLKYGTDNPMDNPLNIRLSEAFGRISKETNGAVEIQLFPDSQLGSDPDMLSQLRSGALDMFTLTTQILARVVPVCSITGMPFVFRSNTEVWAAMDGDLGAHMRGEIAKAGLFAQEKIWDLSWKTMTSSKQEIHKPEDLKNFKIRVPAGALLVSFFKALDASPTTINSNEAYTALQTGVVDGMEVPLMTFETSKFYEVQKSVSLTRQMWDGEWSLANGATWKNLPADIRTVISKHLDQSGMQQRDDVFAREAQVAAVLPKRGLPVFTVDQAPFHARLQNVGFYKDWKAKYTPQAWALLEKYTGPIA